MLRVAPEAQEETAMSTPGATRVDIREEVDVIKFDPVFYERQRSRYASRGVTLVVLLNGLAAIATLVILSVAGLDGALASSFADAMVVFAAGAAAGFLSKFFAYLRRTIRLERPDLQVEGRPLRWLAVAAAAAGAACFVAGFIVVRDGVAGDQTKEPTAVTRPDAPAAPPTP